MGLLDKLSAWLGGGRAEVTVLVLGLDNSGKSTLLNTLRPLDQRLPHITPTVASQQDHFQSGGVSFSAWDVSGAPRHRVLWERHYRRANAVIFVVDSADHLRLVVAREELELMLAHPDMFGRRLPLLVFANKCDAAHALSPMQIASGVGVIAAPGSENAPGELGKPVVLPKNMSEDAKLAVAEGWKKNAFNQFASDLISIKRKLPDPRDEWCKQSGRYLEDLPQTSVVICFHNEAWSVLLRTVHSVLDRSPEHLIKEIILVDDYSDMPHLMQQLEDYMSALPKVRIVRAGRREGLIRARLLGARYVTAPVLTYLDSHCECTEGWLEPLLDRIARNKTTVVCPVIDVIDDNTLEYHYRDSTSVNVGGFDWNLQFNWHPVPAKERARHQHTAEPVWSPTMAGGLFAIDKEFFERLGTYDSGFDIWGGENLELSFKTWMCGGTLEIVPCSHVGHIFRKRSPYKWRSGVNVLKKNSVRLAEVWLDDYAKYYYQRVGNDKGDYGDISGRRSLREKLGCKSFDWYLKNIYPELFIPGESVAHGEVRNHWFGKRYCLDGIAVEENTEDPPVAMNHKCHGMGGNQIANPSSDMCLDSAGAPEDLKKPVNLWPCHGEYGNQYWMYSKNGEIRRDETCLDYSGHDVVLYPCHGAKGNQLWLYDHNTKLLKHGSSEKCMAISRNKEKIVMETCNDGEKRQMWTMENFNINRLKSDLTAE